MLAVSIKSINAFFFIYLTKWTNNRRTIFLLLQAKNCENCSIDRMPKNVCFVIQKNYKIENGLISLRTLVLWIDVVKIFRLISVHWKPDINYFVTRKFNWSLFHQQLFNGSNGNCQTKPISNIIGKMCFAMIYRLLFPSANYHVDLIEQEHSSSNNCFNSFFFLGLWFE